MTQTIRPGAFLACGMLALTFIKPVYAQQPAEGASPAKKADPNVVEDFPSPAKDFAQPEMVQVSNLASRLLQYAETVDCKKHGCEILVTDFTTPDGSTSPYGTKLADELAAEIARQRERIHVTDRSLLKGPLDKLRQDRVPASIQHSVPVVRWLGQELGASVLVIGEIDRSRADFAEVSARLQNVKDRRLTSPSVDVALPLPASTDELSPTDPLAPLPQLVDKPNGERLYHAGMKGLGMPKCTFMPNPPYTDEARKFYLSGAILVEGIIEIDGSVKPLRIIQGLPFGLNDTSFRTLQRFKCSPATLDGKPVRSLVPFEITFRLY